ncbi:flavin reductase family protein [Pseudomonas sp. LS1212]|uniref:flavin reductase family protein n=1 Tax=Pseudomonas sp. LS1212 TaxID=2972478 RepID=UPI00215BFBA8|nr:flavin reductase family protein [Pseudomonas sp. LS1212]UVJ45737.1 flavin reductase family protein [Pseudomonas sp. LS1212]
MQPEIFKEGMRRLAASVCVITTQDPMGGRYGITATAVCSVTADPPMLLCCMNRSNGSYDTFLKSGRFAVNLLGTRDNSIATRFAGRLSADERFQDGDWGELATGAPVLLTAEACFDCETAQVIDVGTHTIFVGNIKEILLSQERSECLLYGDGQYGRFDIAKSA